MVLLQGRDIMNIILCGKKQKIFTILLCLGFFTAISPASGQSSNTNAVTYYNRGLEFQRKGNIDKAIADYTQAIRHDPSYTQAYNYRGFAYYNKNEYDRAIADFSLAIRLAPKNSFAYNFRGSAYAMKGDYELAIADWEAVLSIDPENTSAKSLITSVRQIQGYEIGL